MALHIKSRQRFWIGAAFVAVGTVLLFGTVRFQGVPVVVIGALTVVALAGGSLLIGTSLERRPV